MIRFCLAALAAAILTSGAVASLAATPKESRPQVSIDKAGYYCVTVPATGAELVAPVDCRSADDWAKAGVTFSRR